LGIRTEEDLQMHPLKGSLFESFVMSEFFKYNYNRSELPNIYFWRDVQGHEIDGIIELKFESVIPIEIKSGMTITKDFFKGLRDWNDITKQTDLAAYVVYGGTENLVRQQYRVFAWSDVPAMLDTIYQKNE